MLYYFVRPLARIALKFWFRKIYRTHLDRVPRDKPVIFAVNHPTIFIEPCLLACYQPRALFFLTKGILFQFPFVSFLKSLHMVPIYRQQDGGFGKRKSNVSTFDYCYQLFDRKDSTMIMPEGSSAQVKYLRPLTKGFARLAFGYYEVSGNADLYIMPVGINYTDPDVFRSEVSIGFGKPLHLERYLPIYKNNPRAAKQKLVEDLYREMKTQVIDISNEDLVLSEQLWTINRNEAKRTVFPILETRQPRLKIEKRIGENITKLSTDKKHELSSTTDRYFKKLDEFGITDHALNLNNRGNFLVILFFIVALIPAIFGYITNILPYLIGQAAGSFTNDVETRMSVVLGISFGVYLIYMTTLLIITIWNGLWIWLGFVLLIPVCGYLSLVYWEKINLWMEQNAVKKLGKNDLINLQTTRLKLMKKINEIKN